jgi:hypothetical protein
MQLLASYSVRLHQHHSRRQLLLLQQQGSRSLRLTRQLDRRMRGDLLLLPDPQQRLAELMPADQLIIESHNELLDGHAVNLLTLLDLHLASNLDSNPNGCVAARDSGVIGGSSSSSSSSSSTRARDSSLAVPSAALQLSSQLLLQAAASWQQTYYQLSPAQQALLAADPAELTQAGHSSAELAYQLMFQETLLLCKCQCLLQTVLDVLRSKEELQQQLQLLQQQGGGQVLLQGLTLAAHCGSLHRRLQRVEFWRVPAVFALLSTPSHMHMAGTLQTVC